MPNSCLLLLVVLSVLVTVSSASSGAGEATVGAVRAAPQGPLLPGDPAPPLNIGEWLQKGAFDQVRPANGRLITVIEFFGSWDPLSRVVLLMHDKLQAELGNRGVRFLAVSQEDPSDIRAYLKQAKLKNLAVACDKDETTLGAYRGEPAWLPIPYAAVLGGANGERILWAGPVVARDAQKDPAAEFLRVLTEAVEGQFDVSAARQKEVRRRELRKLRDGLEGLVIAGKLDELRSAARAAQQKWRQDVAGPPVGEILAHTAMRLLQADTPSAEQAALALELLEAAMAAVGTPNCDLLHLYARALFLTGRPEAAVETEQKALASLDTAQGISENECREALTRYRRAIAEKRGESVPEEHVPPQATTGPAPPPETLIAGDAASDLAALYEHLRLNYAAHDDAAWRLAGRGSSWDDYNQAFARRAAARLEWTLPAFAELVTEYLSIYQDRHLRITRRLPEGGQQQSYTMRGFSPNYAGLRVRESDGRMVVADAPDTLAQLKDKEVVGLSVIGSPATFHAGEVCLFPTLPSEPGRKEFLVGLLASDPAPDEAVISVRGAPGMPPDVQEVRLPLHRGRARFQVADWDAFMKAAPWSFSLEPLPVLAVRRMWGDGFEGLPETGVKLRELPVVILDLRANGGGADTHAWDWAKRFTNQPLRMYLGAAHLHMGETDPLRRWESSAVGWGCEGPQAPDRATAPYAGRLFVLIDSGVASSGESFATIAMEMAGAVLLGENTAGFGTYGNVNQHFELPHSLLQVRYGYTKFVNAGRAFREGAGFFPDYWLDTDDPVSAVAEYASRR